MHLVGDLFELYDDARTYKPYIFKNVFMVVPLSFLHPLGMVLRHRTIIGILF